MSAGTAEVSEKLPSPTPDYDKHPAWRQKPLTPAQLLVHDVSYKSSKSISDLVLDITEKPAAALVPDRAPYVESFDLLHAAKTAHNPIEARRFEQFEHDFGWIRSLRLQPQEQDIIKAGDVTCRWLHVSSKFPEYISGFFYALSGESADLSNYIRSIDHAVERQTRHSKHGKYFAPFCQVLGPQDHTIGVQPVLISSPWLDWSVCGPAPPLRFQIDRREGFRSVRSSVHMLRSILQHYYRLEDTVDREKLQVFTKHTPWTTNKELDLQIRQWYGRYPTALVVDELWVLVVDAANIVTFSSNVSWKSRWPPLQLASRIANVSFRNMRNDIRRSRTRDKHLYSAASHALICLSGAMGMLHRNFWPDMPLCLTDRYAGYLGHLQYRLHRAPNTKLVMSLISCFDELNIVIQITQQQLELLAGLEGAFHPAAKTQHRHRQLQRPRRAQPGIDYSWESSMQAAKTHAAEAPTYTANLTASNLDDPLAQAIDNLQRELVDLEQLRDNTNALIVRTIQLVNIRLEDNGKSILVFTVVTILFMPLNFVASFFGMNVSDIRTLNQTQSLFWTVAVCVTVGVAALSILIAFQGGRILENIRLWRDGRKEARQAAAAIVHQHSGHAHNSKQGFRVLAGSRVGMFSA